MSGWWSGKDLSNGSWRLPLASLAAASHWPTHLALSQVVGHAAGVRNEMNHNVRLALLFTVFFYISQSIATQGVSAERF